MNPNPKKTGVEGNRTAATFELNRFAANCNLAPWTRNSDCLAVRENISLFALVCWKRALDEVISMDNGDVAGICEL
jgi:hypothetical protein